jgi:hypothetical protein
LLNRRVINFSGNKVFTMPASFKKILFITLLLSSVPYRASSPDINLFIVFAPAPVEPYKQLIYAIGFVETMNNTRAYNPLEEATGIFQIRPIRLKDYNIRTGSNYKMKDLYDYEISEQIFLYFADLVGPYDLEQIARRWNGSGHMTTYYWNRIKEYL